MQCNNHTHKLLCLLSETDRLTVGAVSVPHTQHWVSIMESVEISEIPFDVLCRLNYQVNVLCYSLLKWLDLQIDVPELLMSRVEQLRTQIRNRRDVVRRSLAHEGS